MRIKVLPEDFLVQEMMELSIGRGRYGYYLLRKRMRNTEDIIEEICGKLRIPRKFIGVAGYKDRNAATEQYISLYNIAKEKVENLRLNNATLEFVGNGEKQISLGSHIGNKFVIVVRDIEKKRKFKIDKILNLFDEQRFGEQNIEIGRLLVKRKWKDACKLLGLEITNNDAIGALRKCGQKRLRFFVGSYQSYLFNKTIMHINRNYRKIPIVGYLSEMKGKIKRNYDKIMKMDGIKKMDFLFREMPELSQEGSMRDMYAKVSEFRSFWEKDEVFPGKLKCTLEFSLRPGVYATLVVKELFD